VVHTLKMVHAVFTFTCTAVHHESA